MEEHLNEPQAPDDLAKAKVNRLKNQPVDDFPLFMPALPQDHAHLEANVPLCALQALLYEGTPEEQAMNFKTQGNEAYAKGSKGLKDAVQFYTRGLEVKCADKSLNTALRLNRCAANLGLGNYGDALGDAQTAYHDSDKEIQIKALKRIAKAAIPIQRVKEARKAIDMLKSLGEFMELEEEKLTVLEKELAIKEQGIKELGQFRKQIKVILEGTNMVIQPGCDRELLEQFGPSLDHTTLPHVHLDEQTGRRLWPLIIFYPDEAQSDILEAVDELSSIRDILKTIFTNPPEWDREGQYTIKNKMNVFWHDSAKETLIKLSDRVTLADMLGTLIKNIDRGILSFLVCPPGDATNLLLSRFTIVKNFP